MRTVSFVFAIALLTGGVFAADTPKPPDGGPISAAGILADATGNTLTIWTDGEDAPAKYVFADTFDKKTVRGIFNISRIQFTYTKAGNDRKLLTIKKDQTTASGTVTGTVLLADNFWTIVKPKDGKADGYALGAPPDKAGVVGERLKSLRKGDTVSIKFHTDGERHRIETLDIVATAPNPPASKPAK